MQRWADAKGHTSCVQTYLLQQLCKGRYDPKNITVSEGAF